MGKPTWRQLYDMLEGIATPHANAVTQSDEFAHAIALLSGARRAVNVRAGKVAAKGWHFLNLPAGTDVHRLRMQVGALDREVRLLTLELRRARTEEVRRDGVTTNSDEHP